MDEDSEIVELERWLGHFRALFDCEGRLEPFEGGHRLVLPPVFEPVEMIGSVSLFSGYPAMLEHVRSLGFAWGAEGRLTTVPTPLTFNRLAQERIRREPGFRLEYTMEDAHLMASGPFLLRYLAGRISIHICSDSYYASMARSAHQMRFHFASLVHDISVHGLNYHLMPGFAVEQLRDLVRESIPGRVSTWSDDAGKAPLTLGFFLDNDLNRFCQQIYFRSSSPRQFEEILETNLHQLLDALRVRLEETKRGLGDVPSGFTEDMQPLAPIEFRLR